MLVDGKEWGLGSAGSGSGRAIGPAYSSRMREFIIDQKNSWRPETAAESSESLSRCLVRLEDFLKPDD